LAFGGAARSGALQRVSAAAAVLDGRAVVSSIPSRIPQSRPAHTAAEKCALSPYLSLHCRSQQALRRESGCGAHGGSLPFVGRVGLKCTSGLPF
jgi:hypothetical protein